MKPISCTRRRENESYVQGAINELQRGAAVAGEAVYNNVALPLAQRLGGYAVNTAVNMAAAAVMGRGGLPGVNSNPNRLTMS